MIACPACGRESPDGFKFCGSCGAALAATPAPREVRKVVTVVFCDLTGSTALGDRTDPEALRATMRGYYEQMRASLERHGGTVEKFIGDAVMAVFGVPVAREDDALRAVRAAWEMRAAVPALGLQARIGVNTGEVVAGEGDTLVTGDAVNVAARLEQAAEPGEVLIGTETRRLVRDAVRVEPTEVAAKGKTAPVSAFRLLDVDTEADAIARRFETPLVGREAELDQLRQALERAVREERCHLFTLLGAAGVGKSRLVREFVAGVDATVAEGRCLDYGDGITFWPVIGVLKQLGERGTASIARIVDGTWSATDLAWSVRTLLEEIAAERPVVVVFDDVHWGEPTFLDLIDHIADMSRGAPILLLCVARPELLDRRPAWGGGKLNATTILLEPLTPDECAQLIEVHGGAEPSVHARILESADGNPLFVEEMLALARENGDVRIPSTVHALLQARLDQLATDERSVVECGAVEGQIFHRGALTELARADVAAHLVGLVRKELIHPARSTFVGDAAFQFRHLLIRDAAYEGLPKETRADLHARHAAWLDVHGRELVELDELVGYHLEQAARYRRELGRPDEGVARAAAERLATAGRRAVGRHDLPAGLRLLERAHAVVPPDDGLATGVAIARLFVLEQIHTVEGRPELVEELLRNSDPMLQLHGRLGRWLLDVDADPASARLDAGEELAATARATFEAAGDDAGVARTAGILAMLAWMRCNARDTLAAGNLLSESAKRAGLPPVDMMTTNFGALMNGPFTIDEIRSGTAAIAPEETPFGRHMRAAAETEIATRLGRYEEAGTHADGALAIARELGHPFAEIAAQALKAEALADGGSLDEAIELLRRVAAAQAAAQQHSFRSTTLIHLAEALCSRGDFDEADILAEEGIAAGSSEDVVNLALGRGVRARVASSRGDHDRAVVEAREALELALTTDFPRNRGAAYDVLARALAAAGRRDESRRVLEQAIELWRRYDFTAFAARDEELLVEL